MKPAVFITVDVECSMGGAWDDPKLRPVPPSRAMMGRYGERNLGVPLITDILRQHGLAATFFVEAFAEEQGYPGQTEPVCQYLLDRGQDVQLHIHPNHRHFALMRQGQPYQFTDQFADLPREQQLELMTAGAARLERWTGKLPVAFRAGNMGASLATLELLPLVGIGIDSSYTFPFAGKQCRFPCGEPYNGSRWYGPVLELALSGFCLPRLPGEKPAKPLDLVGVSFEECRDTICRTSEAGADSVLLLHSFSLFKVRNVQYDGPRPNRIVSRRLRRLCEWLANNSARFPTRTLSELSEAVARGEYWAKAATPPRLSGARAMVRKLVQVYNSIYLA